jgi:hypothetical protein
VRDELHGLISLVGTVTKSDRYASVPGSMPGIGGELFMKMFAMIAAGLLGLAATAPTTAVAAPVATVTTTTVAPVQERVVVRERTVVRRDDRGFRGDRGYRNGRNRWGTRQVCTNRWRHGRKVRTCRSVRYRR